MLSTRSIIIGIALAANAVIAAPTKAATTIQARGVIGHDAVAGFIEAVPDDPAGALMLKFNPLLKVTSGCVPFPAVDYLGNTGYVSNLTTVTHLYTCTDSLCL